MLFKNPRRLLSEAASADLLNPEVSDEVKDTINDLEDTLTNNIEEIDDKDKTTNGGIPVVAEAVALLESTASGDTRYLVTLESIIAVKETEGEKAAAEAMEEPGEAPTPEDVEAHEPDAVNVVEDIAEKNGVEPAQVSVVITAESVKFLAQTAILEAKAGKVGDDAKATKQLKKTKDTVDQLKGKINMVKA